MLGKISAILECSRVFSLPMTVMSWLVIFTYSAMYSGNILNGILALIGVCFAHLVTNILDDYFDYKNLIKQVGFNKREYLKNTQKTKCRYLIMGRISVQELLTIAGVYALIAISTGVYLFFKCGIGVVYFALAGAIITISYSFLSKIKLSEIAVAAAYGPALFGGVYYVMTKTYSKEVFLLSIPTMLVTVILLYTHTIMDYEFDKHEGKKTLANSFKTPAASLVILKWLTILAYASLPLLCIFDILDWQVFLVYLTIPLAIDLYKSMKEFAADPASIPPHKWYHFPMENLMGAPSFMIRIYQSRNLMIYFSIIFSLAIILGIV